MKMAPKVKKEASAPPKSEAKAKALKNQESGGERHPQSLSLSLSLPPLPQKICMSPMFQ